MSKKTVLLMSGGMDSLAITAMAHESGDELHALFFNYGQKTLKKELEAFEKCSAFYKISKEKQKIVDLSVLKSIGGSSLTDEDIDVSVELDKKEIPQTYVPFRNSIFLSVAVSYAEVIKADRILIGAVLEDAPGYPDCRPEYYDSFNELIKKGSSYYVPIETPLILMKKSEILQKCLKLKAPLNLSWSCYQSIDRPCMRCDSCLLRQKAFETIGEDDPLLSHE